MSLELYYLHSWAMKARSTLHTHTHISWQILSARHLFQELSVLLTLSLVSAAAVALHSTWTASWETPLKITCKEVHKTGSHIRRTGFISNIMCIKVASQTYCIAFNLLCLPQTVSLSSLNISGTKSHQKLCSSFQRCGTLTTLKNMHYVVGGSEQNT